MDRLHYLADPDVSGFTDYLRRLVVEGNGAVLHVGRGSRRRKVTTLLEAQQGYRWRGRDYRRISADREAFREQMQEALTICGDGTPGCRPASAEYELLYVCAQILEWAHALKDTLGYVTELAQAEALSDHLMRAAALLDGNSDDTEAFGDGGLRSCPRICNLYSLMNERTVAYSGRVAAALCLLCRHYLQSRADLGFVPSLIDFRLATTRPRHNPSVPGGTTFRAAADGREHACWNIRANWILDAVAADDGVAAGMGGSRHERLRQLEAALFMIGGDVQGQREVARRRPARVWHRQPTLVRGFR